MANKKTKNKLSQIYQTIDLKKLSTDARNTLDNLRLATANFRKTEGKEVDAFMLFYNRLVSNKPTAVKTTPEYKEMIKEQKREQGRKMLEAKKAKQESRQGQGSERDASRPAKPFGWRLKGKHNYRKPTLAEIRSGKAYYEGRINRADTKRTKFPMLERGGYMEHGGDVDKGGMIYALRELVPSMEISKKTNVDYWSGIEFIRQRAIKYYINNGDVPYSDEELDRVLTMIGWEYGTFEGYMEHGGRTSDFKLNFVPQTTLGGKSLATRKDIEMFEKNTVNNPVLGEYVEKFYYDFENEMGYLILNDSSKFGVFITALDAFNLQVSPYQKMAKGGEVFYKESHKMGH